MGNTLNNSKVLLSRKVENNIFRKRILSSKEIIYTKEVIVSKEEFNEEERLYQKRIRSKNVKY